MLTDLANNEAACPRVRLTNTLKRSIRRKDLIVDVLGIRFDSKAVPLIHQLLDVRLTEVWIALLQIVIEGVIEVRGSSIGGTHAPLHPATPGGEVDLTDHTIGQRIVVAIGVCLGSREIQLLKAL